MTDLTKITTPFGLLDEATQKALRECGGPYQWLEMSGTWETLSLSDPAFYPGRVYRLIPQPPKPREWWLVTNGDDDDTWIAVTFEPKATQWRRVVHVREVIEP